MLSRAGLAASGEVSARMGSMSVLSRRLVLAAALLVMPVQGVAVTLSVLLCHRDALMQVIGADTGGHHAANGDSQSNDGGAGGGPAQHPCWPNIVSAAPCVGLQAAPLETPLRAVAPDRVLDLFSPDRPDRPPLA